VIDAIMNDCFELEQLSYKSTELADKCKITLLYQLIRDLDH